MQALSLFGQAEGIRRKEAGQDAIAVHNYTFIHAMRSIAVQLARNGFGFGPDGLIGFVTSDDLREYAEAEGIEPDHPNAWGAVFRSAPTGYRFVKTDARQASRIPTNNGREIPTWAVYREDVAA